MSMVEKAKSGHPGGAMGGADFVHILYSEFLRFNPEKPDWRNRDRFFLDPGHMSPMLYSILALIGNYSMDELKKLFQEAGIPPWVRDRTPILYQGDTIVAVPGLGESASARASRDQAGLQLENSWLWLRCHPF